MTDLTTERLDELTPWLGRGLTLDYEDAIALIAMARGKQRAERERDAYMALADTKAAEATALGRERDALREHLPHECVMAVDTEIAAARGDLVQVDMQVSPSIEMMRTVVASLKAERDAFRTLLDDWLCACTEYYNTELMRRTETALSQPTDAGGA